MKQLKKFNYIKLIAILYIFSSFFSTLTFNYYYSFAHITWDNLFLNIVQLFKITNILFICLAVFYHEKNSICITKYFAPITGILSFFTMKNYMNLKKVILTTDQEIYEKINSIFPTYLIQVFYIFEAILLIILGVLLLLKYGFHLNDGKSFFYVPLGFIAIIPLNIFNNFENLFSDEIYHFLLFKSFTVWHLLALCNLGLIVFILYQFLKRKSHDQQDLFLGIIAIIALVHYHSKNSIIIGDGYNIYNTLFSCIPLFICNIGEYIAALSIFTKKKFFYSASFFIHAVGALSVFIYLGSDDASNFGTILNYSALYFSLTHIFLFIMCIMPSLLNHFSFKIKYCKSSLLYYAIVILSASFLSAIVTNYSSTLVSADGSHLTTLIYPNYAFTQVSPFPFTIPPILKIYIGNAYINVVYVIVVYLFYVGIFFAFYGIQRLVKYLFKKYFSKKASNSY